LIHSQKEVKRLEVVNQKLTRTKTYSQNRTNKLTKENKTLKIKLKKLRQTIQDLQNEISNHTCLPCPLPHLSTPHVCPTVQQVNCSHSDYANLQNQLAEKERIIQEQTQRIKELEKKPPTIETKTIEKEVEKGEDLEKIVEINLNDLEEELGINLSEETKERFRKVKGYQELSSLRNQEIKNYLKQNQTGMITQPIKEAESFKNERAF
jgi:hypothetical protein